MHRFFIAPGLLTGNVAAPLAGTLSGGQVTRSTLSLPKPIAHQVRDVLHLAIGEQLLLLDNSGDEILATIATSNRNTVDVQLLEHHLGKSEPPVRIILCQGLLKSARFEWILEKGTELGVAAFVPTLCRRSMSGLEDAGPAKTQRWQRIIQEAAEQSGRSRLPALLPIRPLIHALNDIPPGTLAIMPWEEEHNLTLRDALNTEPIKNVVAPLAGARSAPDVELTHPSITVVLFIGPEGGLTPDETTFAQRHGVQLVTLGPRILRAETAALATIANIMYELA